MITLRNLASPLLELPIASGLRNQIAVVRAQQDGRGTLEIANDRQQTVLHKDDVRPKESRELFILGSGPSVLDISPALLSRMSAGTTIGLNSWVLHDFIPDIYSFEQMENDDYIAVAAGLSKVLHRPEVVDQQPLILHLRPHKSTPTNRLVSIPEALRARTRYYGRFTVETRQLGNLVSDMTKLLQISLRGVIPNFVLLDSGLSVARMIHLGIISGFESIILVGVDIRSTRYFFEEDPTFLKRHNLSHFNPWVSRGTAHDTEEKKNRHFSASEFLPALAEVSRSLGGPEIFVSSEKSMLAAHLALLEL